MIIESRTHTYTQVMWFTCDMHRSPYLQNTVRVWGPAGTCWGHPKSYNRACWSYKEWSQQDSEADGCQMALVTALPAQARGMWFQFLDTASFLLSSIFNLAWKHQIKLYSCSSLLPRLLHPPYLTANDKTWGYVKVSFTDHIWLNPDSAGWWVTFDPGFGLHYSVRG